MRRLSRTTHSRTIYSLGHYTHEELSLPATGRTRRHSRSRTRIRDSRFTCSLLARCRRDATVATRPVSMPSERRKRQTSDRENPAAWTEGELREASLTTARRALAGVGDKMCAEASLRWWGGARVRRARAPDPPATLRGLRPTVKDE